MFKKENFFKNYFNKSKKYKENLKKTKKVFKSFLFDLKNSNIPMLETFEKNYEFNFSRSLINKFNKKKNVIIIGMGGSILGAKSIYYFFKEKIKKKVFFFDNLDSDLISKYKKIKNLKNSCFIVISKSGETLETIKNLSLIFPSKILKKKLIVITEFNQSNLMSVADRYNADIIEHKNFIGGRYSVLSETGMFPAALMGLNLKKFKDLSKLIKNNNFVSSLIQNVASIYTLNSNGITNSVIMNYDSHLNNFGYWYQQLVAESLGKEGKGITPLLSFCPKDHHSLLQIYLDGRRDKFFTFINPDKKEKKYKINNEVFFDNMKFLKNKKINSVVNAQCKATKNIFKSKNIPFREIAFSKKNEEEIGAAFTFLVLETILLARLINVDPFSQPAVEQVKNETKKILK